ncbi:MAG TPA: hypothetical protein VGK74_22565 [Symbiobacteriaceae bacterium]|jgi:cell division protein FtsW (lipid II flippase)
MLMLLILGFLAIIALEVPVMNAKGQKAERRAFWVLLALGFVLSLAMVQQWPVPNPTHFLEAVFKPVSDMLGLK